MKHKKKIILWGIGVLILGFLIQYPIMQNSETLDSWSLPLSGATIVIDPGHGGADGGAVGEGGAVEDDIALAVSKKLANYLQQNGALVYLTREEDKDLADENTKGLARRKSEDIRNRIDFIQERNADFFVTIHLNALASTRWSGAQTFYYPEFDESRHLADRIQKEIVRNLENTNRVPMPLDEVYLLKHAGVPGSLVEIGFLSNEKERELLMEDSYQQQMAASIYEGILRYVTEDTEE